MKWNKTKVIKKHYKGFSEFYKNEDYDKAFEIFNQHPEIEKYFDWGENMKMQKIKRDLKVICNTFDKISLLSGLIHNSIEKVKPIKSAIQYGWDHRN